MKQQLANGKWQSVLNCFRVARLTFREIFDESAYERFLHRTHHQRSVESYRAFLLETESAMARKPRCC